MPYGELEARDNWSERTYAAAMDRGEPHIQLKLDVPNAIELGDFVAAFTALGEEFERYVAEVNPKLQTEATLYVREVRQSSILAILMPWLSVLPAVVEGMSAALTVEDFVRRYGQKLAGFLSANESPADATVAQLKTFVDQVEAIANNPDSKLEVAAVEIENGEWKTKAAFKFDTKQARVIRQNVEVAQARLTHRNQTPAERELMVFTRTDVGTPPVGQSTGERVKIEALSTRSLPLVYASELAEQKIKHEITEASDNVYKKGFVVDVVVEQRNGKPAAYKVTNVHQVIDLPDD